MLNEKSKRAAVSADTDGKQLAPVQKRRRVGKAVKKEEDESLVKTEEEDIEDDLHQGKDEPKDSKKPPAAVKKEEESPGKTEEVIEDDLHHQDEDEPEDSMKPPPVAVKIEEEDETEEKEGIWDDLHQDKDEPEVCKKSPAATKEEDKCHLDAKWDIMYERLRAFKENHGHCE
jgi:hypothetical protein